MFWLWSVENGFGKQNFIEQKSSRATSKSSTENAETYNPDTLFSILALMIALSTAMFESVPKLRFKKPPNANFIASNSNQCNNTLLNIRAFDETSDVSLYCV